MIDLSTGLSSDVGKQSAMHYNSLEDSQRLLEAAIEGGDREMVLVNSVAAMRAAERIMDIALWSLTRDPYIEEES